MDKYLIFLSLTITLFVNLETSAQDRQYYELRTYHCSSADQIERLEQYLEKAFLPLMHKQGIPNIGVFKDLTNDTVDHKKVFVLIPGPSLILLEEVSDLMVSESEMAGNGKNYLMAPHDQPIFDRIETSWHRAFLEMPMMSTPNFTTSVEDRVFELRSYEGASEILYRKKVDMFNAGGEIALFESLGFNAIFYAETVVGAHTPNLVYMTSFENMASRDQHWDAFRKDPRWKKLSGMEKYKNTVSKSDIYLLRPATYSDIK